MKTQVEFRAAKFPNPIATSHRLTQHFLIMPITRLNFFTAKPEQGTALATFLSGVIEVVRKAEGCVSCRLLRDQSSPGDFVILEEWESVDAHQKAASLIPKEQIMSVMQYLQNPPRGDYFVPKK